MSLQSENWFNPSKGEEVLWYSHPSFVMRLPKFLLGAVLIFAGLGAAIYIYFFQDWPIELVYGSLLMIPVGIGWIGWQMMVYKNTWYVITNRRVINKIGIVGRDTSSKPHREIVRVDVKVSTLDAIISRLTAEDIGDIVIRTADDTGKQFNLGRVPEVSLAESYIERLSGTGPDTPAQYDAEERDRLQHEQTPGDEWNGQQQPQNSHNARQQSPGGQRGRGQSQGQGRPQQDSHGRQDQQPPADGQYNNPSGQGNTDGNGYTQPPSDGTGGASTPPPEPAEDDLDEMDEFEPSDKA